MFSVLFVLRYRLCALIAANKLCRFYLRISVRDDRVAALLNPPEPVGQHVIVYNFIFSCLTVIHVLSR